MASAQVVETSVNTNNSPSQDYTTNPDDHSNHNIDSSEFKPFTVIITHILFCHLNLLLREDPGNVNIKILVSVSLGCCHVHDVTARNIAVDL